MKTIKTAVAALVIAAGTISAYAFTSHKESKTTPPPTIYYAIEDAPGSSSYHWSTSIPANFECLPTGKAVCSITTSTPPIDNQLPSGVSSTNRVYRFVP